MVNLKLSEPHPRYRLITTSDAMTWHTSCLHATGDKFSPPLIHQTFDPMNHPTHQFVTRVTTLFLPVKTGSPALFSICYHSVSAFDTTSPVTPVNRQFPSPTNTTQFCLPLQHYMPLVVFQLVTRLTRLGLSQMQGLSDSVKMAMNVTIILE